MKKEKMNHLLAWRYRIDIEVGEQQWKSCAITNNWQRRATISMRVWPS